MKIKELIAKCTNYLENAAYTKNRIDKYKGYWRCGIIPFMELMALEDYTPDVGEAFMETCNYNGEVRHQEREMMRSVSILNDILSGGEIKLRNFTPVDHPLTGSVGKEIEKFLLYMKSIRRSAITIKDHRMYLSRFNSFLDKEGIASVQDIEEHHIIKFRNGYKLRTCIGSLHVFMKYLYENHVIQKDFEYVLKGVSVRRKERIPSYYSKEEVVKIETSVNVSSAVGKRNYAVLLLATRLGLRASDISELKFENIHWKENVIRLTQFKTGKPIELPLLADVGNAILDYLKNGRRKSDSHNVFLSERAPYRPMSRSSINNAVSCLVKGSGVDTRHRHHGPHSMRHSLACCLLEDGTSYPVISESLGHANTEVTMNYLRIDLNSLMKCALDVPPVSDDFYMQKGGAFYV